MSIRNGRPEGGDFMVSTKREQEYEANRRRYKEAQSSFKFSIITFLAVIGSVLVGMTVYYIIRALAMIAGSTMMIGQYLANSLTGEHNTTGIEYTVYYGTWTYLGVTTALFLVAHFFKKRGINKLLIIIFAMGALYGLIGMCVGECGPVRGVYLFVSGLYGIWIQSYVIGLHKEVDYLALQEGFPDFIPALAEPKTMANTIGLTSKKSEFMIRQRKEQRANGEEVVPVSPESMEMDELTLESPPPKSDRKIDNMM